MIRKTLKDEGVNVQNFIRFSAKAPLDNIMQPILSITHNAEQESYILRLKDMLNRCVQELSADVQKLNEKQLALFEQGNRLVNRYDDAISRLGNDCEEAADIPQWTEHWLSKDRYEMNEYQGNRLINLLSMICNDRVDELCDLYNEQMETQRNAQQAYSDYIDGKVKWQEFNDCKEHFDKLVKPFLR